MHRNRPCNNLSGKHRLVVWFRSPFSGGLHMFCTRCGWVCVWPG